MVLKSYAKINLTLSVNKRLKSGLHNVQSIYSLIDLHDKIFLKKIKNKNFDQVSFTGPFSKDINKSNNSVKKVLNAMRKNKIINDYYAVKVNKKIPVFAALGKKPPTNVWTGGRIRPGGYNRNGKYLPPKSIPGKNDKRQGK